MARQHAAGWRCPCGTSSLVRSNFKFTREGVATCNACVTQCGGNVGQVPCKRCHVAKRVDGTADHRCGKCNELI